MTRKFLLTVLTLALLAAPLAACDEAGYEPVFTPPPTSIPSGDAGAPPDMTDEQTPAPTPAPAPVQEPDLDLPDEWPTAYLPENFPVMPHSVIENVRRENGEIKMTVTEDPDAVFEYPKLDVAPFSGDYASNMTFSFALRDMGYADYPLPPATTQSRDCFFNREGTVCDVQRAGRGPNRELIWDITVKYRQTFDFDASFYFIDWPPLETDLGLEEIVFDKWPREYLPEGFPEPIGMTPVSMEQKKNGVFITFAGETGNYGLQLEETGYKKYRTEGNRHPDQYKNPYVNSRMDRYYDILDQAEIDAVSAAIRGETAGEDVMENINKKRETVIQVVKGADTERYWQSQKGE